MKKLIAGIVALVMLFTFTLYGAAFAEEKKISVVTTIFPIYDWLRQIVGDSDTVEITMLLDTGVDLHSYQPTAQDIMKIATCDVFVYVGGESDDWVDDALAESVNPNMIVIDLLDTLGDDVVMEEIVEGMQHEHDEDHDHEDGDHVDEDHEHEDHENEDHDHEGEDHDEHDHEHEAEEDEHVWLSLRNARKLVAALSAAMAQADPAHADGYLQNAGAYDQALAELDARYVAAREAADYDTLLFGDRFPFRYLVDDYDLNYYAAFSGCSAETEASFETIVFLAGKVDELGLSTVLTIEGGDGRIAQTITQTAKAADLAVLAMDSLQSVTAADVQSGVTYLGVMEQNLEVLIQAMSK